MCPSPANDMPLSPFALSNQAVTTVGYGDVPLESSAQIDFQILYLTVFLPVFAFGFFRISSAVQVRELEACRLRGRSHIPRTVLRSFEPPATFSYSPFALFATGHTPTPVRKGCDTLFRPSL